MVEQDCRLVWENSGTRGQRGVPENNRRFAAIRFSRFEAAKITGCLESIF